MVLLDHLQTLFNTPSLPLSLSPSPALPFPPWVSTFPYPRYQDTAIKGTLYFDIKFHFSLWKGRRKTQGKAYKKSTNLIQSYYYLYSKSDFEFIPIWIYIFHWHLHNCKWLLRGCGLLVNLRPGICACQDNQTARRSNCAKISLFNYQLELTCCRSLI